MIPFALMGCELDGKEYSLTDVSVEGFRVRSACSLSAPARLTFFAWEEETARVREEELTDFKLSPCQEEEKGSCLSGREMGPCREEEENFWFSYQIEVKDPDYAPLVRKIMGQYERYVRLKTEESDAHLSEVLTGYPGREEERFAAGEDAACPEKDPSHAEASALSIPKVSALSYADSPALPIPKVSALSLADSPALSIPEVSALSLSEDPALSIPEVSALSLAEAPALSIPEVSTLSIPDSQALSFGGLSSGLPSEETGTFSEKWKEGPSAALCLSTPSLRREFLRAAPDRFRDCFLPAYAGWLGLRERSLLKNLPVRSVYIGNAFCPALFPETKEALLLLEAVRSLGLIPVLETPVLPQESAGALFAELKELGEKLTFRLELVVNDWGTAEFVRAEKLDLFELTLGTMLQKRKKDPRMIYVMGAPKRKADGTLPRKASSFFGRYDTGSLRLKEFALFLKEEYAFQRAEYECCEACVPEIARDFGASLRLPYYQMNTGTQCPLRAVCEKGARGKIQEVNGGNCPCWCERYFFRYPEMLKMKGRFNSLFGRWEAGASPEVLSGLVRQGVDRLVFDI